MTESCKPEATKRMAWACGIFEILSIKMVHSGAVFVLFCTVNWLDVQGLNVEVGGLTSEVGSPSPAQYALLTLTTGQQPDACTGVRMENALWLVFASQFQSSLIINFAAKVAK